MTAQCPICAFPSQVTGALQSSRFLALWQFNREALSDGLRTCERAKIWIEVSSDTDSIVGVQAVHGGILVELGDIEGGLEILNHAMRLASENKSSLALWRAQIAYAGALFDTEEFDRAADTARESLPMMLATDPIPYVLMVSQSIVARMLSRALAERKLALQPVENDRVAEARTMLEATLQSAIDGDHSYEMAEMSCYLGVLAWVCSENIKAAEFLSFAATNAERAGDTTLIAEIGYWMAALDETMGAHDQARAHLERIKPIIWGFESPRRKGRYFRTLARLEASAGCWKSAYEYHCLFHEQVQLDHKRLRSARAQVLQISLELEQLRQRENNAREERERLLRDNERLERERQTLTSEALRDPLTGLGNRRQLNLHREQMVREKVEACAILLLDLDHFKRINDTLSHAAGDAVLSTVGRLLRTSFRDRDCPVRLGGEEFVVLLPGVDLALAVKAAERLRQTIAGHDWTSICRTLAVTCSIGVAPWNPSTDNYDLAFSKADQSLYAAKQAGRNRCLAAA